MNFLIKSLIYLFSNNRINWMESFDDDGFEIVDIITVNGLFFNYDRVGDSYNL